MSDSQSLRAAPPHGRHKGKGSSRKDSSTADRSSDSREGSGRGRPADDSDSEGPVYRLSPAVARPSTSQAEACAPPWHIVMEALADLQADMKKLKEERTMAPDGVGVADTVVNTPPPVRVEGGDSPCFSGFPSVLQGAQEEVSQVDLPADSVLRQCAKSYGPVEDFAAEVDKPVADMVNHVFVCGMREDEYREILEADVVKRPSNCPALAPIECNTQVLEALKTDGKKADFRLIEVSKDIVKAATIVTKSLTVLDTVALEGRPEVANEIHMLNGALALLGHANHRTNLMRSMHICALTRLR